MSSSNISIRCLSVQYPWAEYIRTGEKTVELRTWATDYRGPLAIASSLSPRGYPAKCNTCGREWPAESLSEECYPCRFHEKNVTYSDPFPAGKVIALCHLEEVRPSIEEDKEAACWHIEVGEDYSWVLREIQSVVNPWSVRGRLGLYEVTIPDEIRIPAWPILSVKTKPLPKPDIVSVNDTEDLQEHKCLACNATGQKYPNDADSVCEECMGTGWKNPKSIYQSV